MANWTIGIKLDPEAAPAPDKPGHLRTTSQWKKDGNLISALPVSISKSSDRIFFVFYGPNLANNASFAFRWIKSPFTDEQVEASPFDFQLDNYPKDYVAGGKRDWPTPFYKWGGSTGLQLSHTGVYQFTVDVDTPASAGGAKYWVDPEMIIDT